MKSAYKDIVKAILNKKALLFNFRLRTCNFLEHSSHVVWSAQLEVSKDFV